MNLKEQFDECLILMTYLSTKSELLSNSFYESIAVPFINIIFDMMKNDTDSPNSKHHIELLHDRLMDFKRVQQLGSIPSIFDEYEDFKKKL